MPSSGSIHPFDLLVQRDDRDIRLAEAGLLLARDHYPGLKVGSWLTRFDHLARRVELAKPSTAMERIAALRAVLVEEEELTGNVDDYYDPRNCFLHEVLERRKGIPISLSVIWLEICRQFAWPFEGVGLPGHFLIVCSAPEGEILIDPFAGGRIVERDDCQDMVSQLHGISIVLSDDDFKACSHKAILSRMLNNLRSIYVKRGNWRGAACVLARLLALQPDSRELRAERDAINARLARRN